LAARTQPFSLRTIVIGSLATSSVSDRACAAPRATSGERRASPNFFASGDQLVLHQLLQLGLAVQRRDDAVALGFELGFLAADLHFLQARQLAQPGLQDVVGLVVAELEALHQHRLGFVLAADDADHLIQVEKRDQQAFQQVQAALDLVEAVLEAAGHRIGAEIQPLAKERLESLHLRAAVEPDDVQVDAEALFQVGRGEQMPHQLFGIDAIGARYQHDARGIGVVGLVADVLQPRQLLRAHLRGDLLDHLARRRLVGQRGDDDIGAVLLEHGAGAHAAQAGFIHREQVRAWRDDLGRGRVVRAEDVLAQVARGRVGIVEQAHAGADHFIEVVRRHVGGHADGDAGGAVEQQVRQARRHPGRFFQRAVEVRGPSRPCPGPVRPAALPAIGVSFDSV
jgi:hypothetical protein